MVNDVMVAANVRLFNATAVMCCATLQQEGFLDVAAPIAQSRWIRIEPTTVPVKKKDHTDVPNYSCPAITHFNNIGCPSGHQSLGKEYPAV